MTSQRMGGIVLLAAGIVLFIIGLNASDSVADQFSEFFTGHFTDTTVWYIAGGGALALVGLMMTLFAGRGSRA